MTRLEELLYALTSVIIRYHDSQPKVLNKLVVEKNPILLGKKVLAYAKEIIHDENEGFKARLEEIIQDCTSKGYTERNPFLRFILNEIVFLKSMQDRKKSFDPSQLEEYKKQTAQILLDLKQLMITPKSKTCRVTYTTTSEDSEPNISLSGLKNDGYYGGEFCNSGNLINEEVLLTFNIHINSNDVSECSSDEELKEIASDLCLEHQNRLLVPELSELVHELTDHNKELRKTIKTQAEESERDKKKILEQETAIQGKDKEIEKLKAGSITHPVFNPVLTLPYGTLFGKTALGQKKSFGVINSPTESSEPPSTGFNPSPSMGNEVVD